MSFNKQKRKKTNVGISITRHAIEVAVYSEKGNGIEFALSVPTPAGMLDANGDQVVDKELLRQTLVSLVRQVPGKHKFVNLSVPGSLLRMVPMPRLDPEELYVSLSSEAERYQAFNGTDAVVDFHVMDLPPAGAPPNMANVFFGAVRKDSLDAYIRAIQSAKLKLASVEVEQINVMRGMAATGVLDSLVQQIGATGYWGVIFVEPDRVRISLWQGNQLLEFRETNMSTDQFATVTADSIVLEDILEEVRRSTKMFQPSIWLTHNMPQPLEQLLTERLGVPVRACPLGDGIPLANPEISLPVVGAAVASTLTFPVPFDIMAGLGRGGGGGSSQMDMPDVQDDSPLPALAIGLGILTLIVSALGWGGLLAANEVWAKPTISGLETRQQEADASARRALVGIIESAKIRNRVYTDLISDVRHKAPGRLWVSEMDVGPDIKLKGKALSHEDVLKFARSFDGSSYMQQVLVEAIHEELIQGSPVLHYRIRGNVNLDASLISDQKATADDNAPPEPAVTLEEP